MLSTIPCDTPTNWTALATGATAATSRITGFASYIPGDSLRVEKRPSSPEDYPQLRAAEFLWEAADRQGRKTIMINYPFSWHSQDLAHGITVGGDTIARGRAAISGGGCLCTPDRMDAVRGSKPIALHKEGDIYVGVVDFSTEKERVWSAVGEVETGRTLESGAEETVTLRPLPGATPRLRVEDASGHEVAVLVPGEWSAYRGVPLGPEVGWMRFLLVHLSEDGSSMQVCHSMISREEGWTKPAHLARRLLENVGPFQPGEETGAAAGRGQADPYTLEAYADTLRKTGEILVGYARQLAEDEPDWDQIYLQLHSNDGLNHWMLGHLDPSFPLATPESTAFAERMYRRNYIETDRVLGNLAELAEQYDAVLVAVADHSAVPTHTWVDTSKPFMDKGWMAFDEDGGWDPARSQVRAMINHSIYVNVQGRHPDGIVNPDAYEAVRDEIISTLLSMRDSRTGACPIAIAARREDMDSVGGNGENFGDVIYLMRPGYTNQPASEGTLLTTEALGAFVQDAEGGLRTGYTYHRRIQGNHHDYLPNATYPGLCSNRAILLLHGPGIRPGVRIRNARTIDVAPTLAALMGIEPPAQAEGHVLYEVFEPSTL